MDKKAMIAINDLVDCLQNPNKEVLHFVNKKNGRVLTLVKDALVAAENSDESELPLHLLSKKEGEYISAARGLLNSEDWLEFEEDQVDEKVIQREFCDQVLNLEAQLALAEALTQRKGAKKFYALLYQLGLEQEWRDHYRESLSQIAEEWCENRGLEYK